MKKEIRSDVEGEGAEWGGGGGVEDEIDFRRKIVRSILLFLYANCKSYPVDCWEITWKRFFKSVKEKLHDAGGLLARQKSGFLLVRRGERVFTRRREWGFAR